MEQNSFEDISDLNKVLVTLEEEGPLRTNKITTFMMYTLVYDCVSNPGAAFCSSPHVRSVMPETRWIGIHCMTYLTSIYVDCLL